MNEIPSIFELPSDFLAKLPENIVRWLGALRQDIDGYDLERLKKQAEEIAGPTGDAEKIYRIGRRAFYRRMQEIVDLMYSGSGLEVGIDLIWEQTSDQIPGDAVGWMLKGDKPRSNKEVLAEFSKAV